MARTAGRDRKTSKELRYGETGANARRRSVELTIDRTGVRSAEHRISCQPVSLRLSEPERLGEMSVIAASNSICALGLRPASYMASILLPPGTEEPKLRAIAEHICLVCAQLDIRVEDLRAEVTNAVLRPVVTGSCTGREYCSGGKSIEKDIEACPECAGDPSDKEKEPGERTAQIPRQIVMTKWAGLEATWLLASEKYDALRERFPESILERARSLGRSLSVCPEAEIAAGMAAKRADGKSAADTGSSKSADTIMTALGEGGVLAGLWRLSERTGSGFIVNMHGIPLLQETIEITNYLGINPYQMRSAGSLLIVTEDAEALIGKLQREGIFATRIGELTGGRDRLLLNWEERRYLDRPQADELLRIFDL